MRRSVVVAITAVLLGAACGGEAAELAEQVEQEAGDAAERIEDAAGQAVDEAQQAAAAAGARGVAEALRAALLAQDLGAGEDLRSVPAIEDAIADLPGDPRIEGLEDTDGDGRDDDGQLVLNVGAEQACVSLGPNGDDVQVTGGAC